MPVALSFSCRTVLVVTFLLYGVLAQAEALVRGQVTDAATGRPLASADVRLLELARTTTTSPGGAFSMLGVPAGQYTLRIRYIGYVPQERALTVPESGAVTEDVGLAAVGEEIVVTGFRASQASSLMDKRMSDIIKESVTADDAGKLPDQNAAEALRRITGVTSTIDHHRIRCTRRCGATGRVARSSSTPPPTISSPRSIATGSRLSSVLRTTSNWIA